MRLKIVDLPAPEGPTSATVSPGSTLKLTPASAGVSSYENETFSNVTSPRVTRIAFAPLFSTIVTGSSISS